MISCNNVVKIKSKALCQCGPPFKYFLKQYSKVMNLGMKNTTWIKIEQIKMKFVFLHHIIQDQKQSLSFLRHSSNKEKKWKKIMYHEIFAFLINPYESLYKAIWLKSHTLYFCSSQHQRYQTDVFYWEENLFLKVFHLLCFSSSSCNVQFSFSKSFFNWIF